MSDSDRVIMGAESTGASVAFTLVGEGFIVGLTIDTGSKALIPEVTP